jgi:hypothetical protein
MNTYVVIGAPGQGKSEYVKKFIDGKRVLVFDIQNEYGTRTKYANQKPMNLNPNTSDLRSRFTGDDIETFIKVAEKKRDTIIVCEEATAFFRGRQSKGTARMLINRYHTGNVYFFLFHSINRVPPEVMEMCNYVILFKTVDESDTVARKYKRLFPYYMQLQDEGRDGQFLIIKII